MFSLTGPRVQETYMLKYALFSATVALLGYALVFVHKAELMYISPFIADVANTLSGLLLIVTVVCVVLAALGLSPAKKALK